MGIRSRRSEARGGDKPTVRSSVKQLNAANDNLIDRTIETWQPRFDHDLSQDDSRQIIENVTGFFSILAEWSRAEIPVPANDTGVSTLPDDEGA